MQNNELPSSSQPEFLQQIKSLISEGNSMAARLAEFEQILSKKNNEIDLLQDMLSEATALNSTLENQIETLQHVQQGIDNATLLHYNPTTIDTTPDEIDDTEDDVIDNMNGLKEKNRSLKTQIAALKHHVDNLQQSPLMVATLQKRIIELEKNLNNEPANKQTHLYTSTPDTPQILITATPTKFHLLPFISSIKNILFFSKKTWLKIKTVSTNPIALLYTFVLPMAFVTAIITCITYCIGSFSHPLNGLKWGLIYGAKSLATTTCSFLICTYIIDELAPTFSIQKNIDTTAQLVAYSLTPICIAAIFFAFPSLAICSLVGLYAVYLLFTGIAVLKSVPPDSYLLYFIIVALIFMVCTFSISILFEAIIYGFTTIVHAIPANK
jgi:hypothetical protein